MLDGALVTVALASLLIAASTLRSRDGALGEEAPRLRPGDRLEPIGLRSAEGEVSEVGEGRTLLLVFRSTCVYCERNAGVWRELVAQSPDPVRVLAVSPEEIATARRWVTEQQLMVDEVLSIRRPSDLSTWKMPGVPVTVIAQDRRVRFVAYGVIDALEATRALGFLDPEREATK